MRTIFTAIIISVLSIAGAYAQHDNGSWTWEDFAERMTDEGDEAEGIDPELMEQLEQLHSSPMDINTAKAEDLQQLPFLNTQQINDILSYRAKNGALFSLGELMLIRSLSRDEREMLRLFVYVDENQTIAQDSMPAYRSRHNRYGHELVVRSDIPFYTKAGYASYPDSVVERSPNKVYQGDRFHHALRYAATYGKHYMAGFQAEKDAGERGVDYLSAYAMAQDVGIVSRAIVGNYRVSFGKGLAVNSGMRLGKLMMLNSLGRMDAGFTRHSSTAEYGYMTGAAATIAVGNVQLSAFASRQKADGTFRSDSVGITAFKTDGLHRTRLERSKDGNVTVSNVGGNVHVGNHNAAVSATFIATHLSTPLAPANDTPSSLYRLYNPQGTDFMNASISYLWHLNTLTITGETAFSNAQGYTMPAVATPRGRQSGMATLNTVQWRINAMHTLTAVARWYGSRYVSLNGRAFGENSSVQNEEGVLLGWAARMANGLKLTAYADYMYFPWMKYLVSDASHGIEAFAQAEYTPLRRLSLMLRYRVKAKERDWSYGDGKESRLALRSKTTHNVKAQASYAASSHVTLRTLAVANVARFAGATDCGFSLCENVRWQDKRSKARVDVGVAYFKTDSYDSRISVYEPSLLYSFGMTSYAYHGIRPTLLAAIPLRKSRVSVTAKLGCTYYFNRSEIGTGTELISSNHREDLQLQLRWKL